MRNHVKEGKTDVIYAGRGTGKTSLIVEWLKEDDSRVMVTHGEAEKARLVRQFGLAQSVADRIVTGDLEQLRGRSGEIGVDNIDLVVQKLMFQLSTVDLYELLTGIRPDYATADRGPNLPYPQRVRSQRPFEDWRVTPGRRRPEDGFDWLTPGEAFNPAEPEPTPE